MLTIKDVRVEKAFFRDIPKYGRTTKLVRKGDGVVLWEGMGDVPLHAALASYVKYLAAGAIETALAWHGGGDSALYRFGSCRCIVSGYHRFRLVAEVSDCLFVFWAGDVRPAGTRYPEHDPADGCKLENLLFVVTNLPVGHGVPA